jgi:preprotein translocase subunit SecG
MGFIIGLLTIVLVVDCLLLIFLVLIQLPKKEAGAGLAFGGAATDALFGAGSGNVLTKVTKYAATVFFVLALILATMQSRHHRRSTSEFERNLQNPGRPAAGALAPAPTPATGTNAAAAIPAATNAPAVPKAATTNAPAPAAQPK